MTPVRVVSLVPSATESLVALGSTPVGCTRFCELAGVPTVGGTKNVDVDAVVALVPDIVIVNDEENRLEDAQALAAHGLVLHSMSPHSIDDVGPSVCALAEAIGVAAPHPFDEWESWRQRTRVAARTSAFIPIWRRPWMSLSANTYGSSLLHHLGIVNVFADAALRYPEVALSEVAARAPDVVLLPNEPYEFTERHAREIRESVPATRTILIDGRDLFWWGTRTPAAVERLRGIA